MIKAIDHIVLHVSDIKKAKEFYNKVLGLEIIEFGEQRVALKIGNQKINLHEKNTLATPKAKNFEIGVGDLCLLSDVRLSEIKQKLEDNDIEVILYDVDRTGANNKLKSLYFYDFDGNLIEISNEII